MRVIIFFPHLVFAANYFKMASWQNNLAPKLSFLKDVGRNN